MTPDEQALIGVLAEQGVAASAVAWDEAQVDWGAFAGLIIRSAWNYHEQPEAFRAWLAMVEQAGVPLWNAPQIIRWNMEKTYLRELAQQGVAIVPTVWLEKGEAPILADILAAQNWSEAVVKPVISASGQGAWVTTVTEPVAVVTATGSVTAADQSRFEKMVAQRAVMVQQRMPIEQGEWSLIFLGGAYSHGVIKRPAKDDFRVQGEYGGTSTWMTPPESLVEQARQILETAAWASSAQAECLYARVDGMDINGRFVLMELELIEPYLFLGLEDGGVERFAAQINKLIK